MRGALAGKVNGYDPALERDSVYFKNMIYPDLFANAPLQSDGSFRFDAADIVGSLDGLHTLGIYLKPRIAPRHMDPDTLRVHVSIP